MNKKQAELQRVARQLNSEEKYTGFDDSVMKAAQKQADEVLQQAKQQSEELYDSLTASQRTDPVEAYRAAQEVRLAREVAFQQQENRKKLLLYRRQLVNALFAEQAEALDDYRKQPEYHADMQRRMQELLPYVTESPVILVRREEENTLGELAKKIFAGCTVKTDSAIELGGFKLETGRVRYDATLDFAQKEERQAFLTRCGLRVE